MQPDLKSGATVTCLYGSVPIKFVVKRKQKPSELRNNFHNPRESKTSSPGEESKRPPNATSNSRSQIGSVITKSLSWASASSAGPPETEVAPSEMPPMRAAILADGPEV